jgi:hypothetical protein
MSDALVKSIEKYFSSSAADQGASSAVVNQDELLPPPLPPFQKLRSNGDHGHSHQFVASSYEAGASVDEGGSSSLQAMFSTVQTCPILLQTQMEIPLRLKEIM